MSSRSRQILGVFARRMGVAAYHARFGLAAAPARRAAFARQTRLACEELGPAFIKLGQLASVRPDVFSPELVFELEKLQDSVAPVPIDAIRRAIGSELGRPPEEVYASFEEEPLASASIAQVHRATLAEACRSVAGGVLECGCDVVVKVVKPGAAEAIEADLEVARVWAQRLRGFGPLKRLDLEAFLGEFEMTLRSELDLRNEGRIADRFAFDFRDDALVFAPRVVWGRSTRRVLTMEFIEGWRLSELDAARRAGIDGHRLAVHGAEIFMRQVLVLGRYHADLHPANLFVTPDSRICYLDFGITGRTSPDERMAIAQVLAATVYGDADRALRYSAELGLEVPAEREREVRDRVAVLLAETMGGPGPSDVRGFAVGFLSLLADYDISVPAGYGLLIKALVTVEGVARALYPDIDIAEAARPFATRLIAREMVRPERIAARAPEALRAALRVLAE